MSEPEPHTDADLQRIVAEEEACLKRILQHLEERSRQPAPVHSADYDQILVELRDEIASARLEDVPPLIAQMERMQMLAARRRQGPRMATVDTRSPYFGRLVLIEGGREREVLIGRTTYLDTEAGVRIVDWRDAPVSQLYYRYAEGEEYTEVFGEREIEGEVAVRRGLSIVDQRLRRISAPQGSFARARDDSWRRLDLDAARFGGGQGSAARAEQQRPGRLGVRDDLAADDDKHLREITALIDPQQFDLITRPDSGLVVIQGGAGSGKTTIGLHRLAYLSFQDTRRFRADRMLVVVFNEALVRYISLVLPALDVKDVAIRTYQGWAARLRTSHFPGMPERYRDDTPAVVTRLKKHPAMLSAIDTLVAGLEETLSDRILAAARQGSPDGAPALVGALDGHWQATAHRPLAHRLHALSVHLGRDLPALGTDTRVRIERALREGLATARDVVGSWSDLLTDRRALQRLCDEHAPTEFSDRELRHAHAWCSARCGEVLERIEQAEEEAAENAGRSPAPRQTSDDDLDERSAGIDGRELEESAALDREDDTLLLRLHQRLRGPLLRGRRGKEALVYEHVFVDEAQDLSPVELAVVLDTVSPARSVTLAGDVSQRLLLDNGFTDWKQVLGHLDLAHVAIEPLRLSYRSTTPIIDFARDLLGPLAAEEECSAVRDGAPVELMTFAHSGEAAGFLAEALRELALREPLASVAIIARYPEQADLYFAGLHKGEVPRLRRIGDQDFPFKPGVDVTDVRQVKGLEFDYVVLVDVNDSSYPADHHSRHLLHIAATRAAHQLWVLTTGRPSPLLPEALLERSY